MRNILAPRNAASLGRFVRQRVLLALDFDGTLAPIVERPADARLPEKTAGLLQELALRYPVVIISGRSVDDVRARLGGATVATIVGNHGIEPSSDMHSAADTVAQWATALSADVAGMAGVQMENKRHSLAVHYRRAPSPSSAHRAIRRAAERLPGAVRVVEGIMVLNIVPAGAPNKGDALQRLRAQFGVAATLYAGDDVTDEDAFAAQDPEIDIGIRVGLTRDTHARYYIPSQPDIDRLLALLIERRRETNVL